MTTSSCVVGTWSFSLEPVVKAMQYLRNNTNAIDAIEAGLNVAELDERYGPGCVGSGGWQNAELMLELDAAIMDGANLNFGAVTALKGYRQAISVARRVLEKSPHSMLTGEGAAKFAKTQGFQFHSNLGRSPELRVIENNGDSRQVPGHDTLGILVRDRTGNICAGVTTSGMCGKHPGRVGDSALPGCGLYADSIAGAACCSGDGDEILKYCPSYKVVDLMKQGHSPQNACLELAKEIQKRRGTRRGFEMVIIALDKQGNLGAANIGVHSFKDIITSSEYAGFPYVTFSEEMERATITSVLPLTQEHL